MGTINALYEALADAMLDLRNGKTTREEVRQLLNQFDILQTDVGLATYVMGLLSPWAKNLQLDLPKGTGAKPLVVNLASPSFRAFLTSKVGNWTLFGNPKIRATLTKLEEAASWLSRNWLFSWEDWNKILQTSKVDPAFSTENVMRQLTKDVEDSLRNGETFDKFKERIKQTIKVPNTAAETIFRTQTKRAYVEGQERILSNPTVKSFFPYFLYSATPDSRVRDTHWDMDGIVVAANDSTSLSYLRKLLREYNCRCVLIPISEKEARRRGLWRVLNGTAIKIEFPPEAPPRSNVSRSPFSIPV